MQPRENEYAAAENGGGEHTNFKSNDTTDEYAAQLLFLFVFYIIFIHIFTNQAFATIAEEIGERKREQICG